MCRSTAPLSVTRRKSSRHFPSSAVSATAITSRSLVPISFSSNTAPQKQMKRPILQVLLPPAALFFLSGFVHAASPLIKVLATTGSASEREGALYVAQDQGFFRRHGVDLSLVQARNGPVGMAALSSGESFMHWGSVAGANLGAIAEGADLVFVAGFINRLTGVF